MGLYMQASNRLLHQLRIRSGKSCRNHLWHFRLVALGCRRVELRRISQHEILMIATRAGLLPSNPPYFLM